MKDKSKQSTMTDDQMHNAFKTILTAVKVSFLGRLSVEMQKKLKANLDILNENVKLIPVKCIIYPALQMGNPLLGRQYQISVPYLIQKFCLYTRESLFNLILEYIKV